MTWLFSKALIEDFVNSHSSPARAEEFSEAICLDGGQFAQLNVMPTQHPFWRKGKTMESSDHSRYGQTLHLLKADHGEEVLMWYLEGGLVKTSVPQERELELEAPEVDYGPKRLGLLAKWSRQDAYWKTAQCSLLADSDEFSETWPKWGSMQDGECWELETLASHICATESGSSLPTPSGVNGGTNNTMGRVDEWGGSSNPLRGTVIGSMCLPEFEELVMGWPVQWTALTPFGMDKFLAWRQQHGNF